MTIVWKYLSRKNKLILLSLLGGLLAINQNAPPVSEACHSFYYKANSAVSKQTAGD